MNNIPEVWVLMDDRSGNSKQAIALADILGYKYKIKKIKYNSFANLPNFLIFGLMEVAKKNKRSLKRGKPDIVISAGRRTASIALQIKHRTGCKVVQIMNPDLPYHKFDLIFLPHHDKKPGKQYPKNTIFIHGAVTHQDESLLSHHKEFWKEKFSFLPKPHIAVLVGGRSKHTDFTKINAKKLARYLANMATKEKGSLIVTTSRRTPKPSIDAFKKELTLHKSIPSYIYDFHEDNAANPYLGLLATAEKIVVTGDSISMCSEAIQTMKPVYVFYEENMIGAKHKKYIDYLCKNKMIQLLYERYKTFIPKHSNPNDNLKKHLVKFLFSEAKAS